RFRNTSPATAQLTVARAGHFQPQYGGAPTKVPPAAVPGGQGRAWHNNGPFLRVVRDEGLGLSLPGAKVIYGQCARDAAGKDLVGDLKVQNGEAALVPLEITWKKDARVKTSRELAQHLMALSKKWRTANGGKKPKEILYYGAFGGKDDWVLALKDALGYNTLLPDKYDHVQRDGLHAHTHTPAEIQAFVKTLKDKEKLRVLSFGDEIGLGQINFKASKLQPKFRAWLKAKGVTQADLGMNPDQ